MVSFEKLLATVHPGRRDLNYNELMEMMEKYSREPFKIISVAFLLGFQRGKRAGKEGK